jgi:uncharacterized membrane protein
MIFLKVLKYFLIGVAVVVVIFSINSIVVTDTRIDDCRKKHNVYECELVAVPKVRKDE